MYKPGITARLIDWLKNYKTSDGKGVNSLAKEEPTTASEANEVIEQVHEFYEKLIHGDTEAPEGYFLPVLKR
jgi:hypothetical protein